MNLSAGSIVNKPMNFFIDAHVFDDSYQGSRTYLTGLYSELIIKYRSVHFFLGARKTENLKKEFGNQENITFIRYWSGNKFIRLLFNIPYIILKHHIEIAHYQYISPVISLSREILTIHDVLFLDYPELFPATYRLRNGLLFKYSARKADFLLTVSDYSRESISRHFKIDKRSIHLIPNGVAFDFFSPATLDNLKSDPEIGKYLLYVSRIEPRKNHLLLVKAFTELNLWKDGLKLIFIGTRALPYPELDDYIGRLPEHIRSKILFFDEAHGEKLKNYYRGCSLFVYPSLAEGFGIPPLEAAASGARVICSSATAMREFVFFKEQLFDPTSLDELKIKIIRYLTGTEDDNDEIIKSIKEEYDWKKSAILFGNLIFKKLL